MDTLTKMRPSARAGLNAVSFLPALLFSFFLAIVSGAAAQGAPDRFAEHGPYRMRYLPRALCCDRKGNAVDLYVPDAPGRMPVITWGNGTWAKPEKYDYLLRHLASWGFVVTATRDSSVANGETMRDAVALLLQKRPDILVDRRHVAAVGHSQGAGGAFNAAMVKASGIDTVVAIALPDRKNCSGDDCANIPAGLVKGQSVLMMSGSVDPFSSGSGLKLYFDAVPDGVQRAKALVLGADHNDIQGQPDCAFLAIGCKKGVGAFVPYVTAWLRWRLTGDRQAARIFRGSNAPFLTDPRLREAVQ